MASLAAPIHGLQITHLGRLPLLFAARTARSLISPNPGPGQGNLAASGLDGPPPGPGQSNGHQSRCSKICNMGKIGSIRGIGSRRWSRNRATCPVLHERYHVLRTATAGWPGGLAWLCPHITLIACRPNPNGIQGSVLVDFELVTPLAGAADAAMRQHDCHPET